MNLTELRDELAARATESDERPIDLLAGTHRKITQVKRRRAGGTVAGVVAVIALAASLLPGTGADSPPDPAVTPRADYVENGVKIPARLVGDQLEKAATGTVGQSALEFDWTPTTTRLALYTLCRGASQDANLSVRIRINGQRVGTTGCGNESAELDPQHTTELPADHTLWLDTPLGRSTKVTVALVDEIGQAVTDPAVQLALGIYRDGGAPSTEAPTRVPPASQDDYVKDGIRYRTRVGADALLAAVVGDPGQTVAKVAFTVPSGPIRLRDFCSSVTDSKEYNVSVDVNKAPVMSSQNCSNHSTDAAGTGWGEIPTNEDERDLIPGQVVEATIRLTDKQGRSVPSAPGVRLGLGIYKPGPKRVIDGGPGALDVNLDEWTESGGHLYKLADLRKMPATSAMGSPAKGFSMPTPAGVPFLIAFGSSQAETDGEEVRVTLIGPSSSDPGFSHSSRGGGGMSTESFPAMAAGVARLRIDEGKPKGQLVMAVYTLQK